MLYLWTDEKFRGGGKRGSIAILKAFSTILGMMRSRTGQLSYRHGLVLTSMSQGLKAESIMKSKPKISKLFPFLVGSMKQAPDRMASLAICLIVG